MSPDRHRLGVIGAGWIMGIHLDALDRLGRTQLVGVASARLESARRTASARAATAYHDAERMLDEQRPDVVYIAVPPASSIAACEMVVARGIPFLAEKPLSAIDADGPARVAAAVAHHGLVAAVGYHLRALEALPRVRARLAAAPTNLVDAAWLDSTPAPQWWSREATGGGQVVEQATHLYDLARHLVGEATVVAAASTRSDPITPPGADVADATAAVLRFDTGAVGVFSNSRRQAAPSVRIAFAAEGPRTTIRKAGSAPGDWAVTIEDGGSVETIPPGRDPYERQAEVFLDAVEARDPTAVLSTYADAVLTDRLTRAVVAATGQPG